MTQTDVLSMDVLSPWKFCPHGRFVRRMLCPPDVLSPRTFCPTDVLSLQTFCPHGCFVPTDVLSMDVLSPDVKSPDVLSGHPLLPTSCIGPISLHMYINILADDVNHPITLLYDVQNVTSSSMYSTYVHKDQCSNNTCR
jgi:hypothetical protein